MIECDKCLHDEVCDKSSLQIWHAIFYKDVCPEFLESANQPWIPITERLPEEDIRVLLLCKNKAMFVGVCGKYYGGTESRFKVCTVLNSTKLLNKGRVTHWMPLPEPPKEE